MNNNIKEAAPLIILLIISFVGLIVLPTPEEKFIFACNEKYGENNWTEHSADFITIINQDVPALSKHTGETVVCLRSGTP